MHLSRPQFEDVIADAVDGLPPELAELLENVAIQAAEAPTAEMIEGVGLDPRRDTLFGLYTGVPLDQRGGWYGGVLPDVIQIFRRPLLKACRTHSELIRQIQLTVLHEIGHHFGFSEEEMDAWEEEFEGLEP